VARPGLGPSAILAAAGLIAAAALSIWVAAGLFLLAAANLAFFRNPRRMPPPGDTRIVSPADGRVVEVARISDPEGVVGPGWRIAVFLSIFDGHVQRAPLSGKVRSVRQSGTGFVAAFNPEASSKNFQTRLDLETDRGDRLAVVQIAGLVARRVLCYAAEGESLVRGEPYGLICYGSRVEIYLPAYATVQVEPGNRVRAGETVVAEVES
jgi:phosphatidylserine decarboxylase